MSNFTTRTSFAFMCLFDICSYGLMNLCDYDDQCINTSVKQHLDQLICLSSFFLYFNFVGFFCLLDRISYKNSFSLTYCISILMLLHVCPTYDQESNLNTNAVDMG